MSNATELQKDVLDELDWDPRVDAAHIGVTVSDSVVTLAGRVPSYEERVRAEKAAKRVAGVKGVANELKISLPSASERSDTDLAHTAVNALKWNVSVPRDAITVTVREAWLTLEGEVDWYFQRVAAEKAVRRLTGVKGIMNLIKVRPRVIPGDVKNRIENALRRAAELDASHVTVKVESGTVTLGGRVRSWPERDDAENAAWAAPGVANVRNEIRVERLPALAGV